MIFTTFPNYTVGYQGDMLPGYLTVIVQVLPTQTNHWTWKHGVIVKKTTLFQHSLSIPITFMKLLELYNILNTDLTLIPNKLTMDNAKAVCHYHILDTFT